VEEERLRLILPWKPEGFILTPVSATYPDGLGLPMRDPLDPLGAKIVDPPNLNYTAGGAYPQVIINRFANNKYLDDLDYIQGLPDVGDYDRFPPRNPRLRDVYDSDADDNPVDRSTVGDSISFEYATLFGVPASYAEYAEGEEPETPTADTHYVFNTEFKELEGGVFQLDGASVVRDGEVFNTFFSSRISGPEDVTEPEDLGDPDAIPPVPPGWYTHRPEEILYNLALHEGIFQRTNFFRIEALPTGTRFTRPLRGNGPSGYWGSYEISTSPAKYWGHSHYNYQPGLRTASGRNVLCVGQEPGQNTANNSCENALYTFTVTGANALEAGANIVQGWRDSPGHYAVIVSPLFEKDQRLFHATIQFTPAWCDTVSLDVGSYGVSVNFATQFDVNSAVGDKPFWSEEPWDAVTNGDSAGGVVFTQIFQQRETWVPTPEWTKSTFAGSVGFYSNPLVWAGQPNNYIRRFTVGTRSYELPPNNYPPFLDAISATDPNYPVYDEATDVFGGIIGVHPFEKDGRTWLRVIVVETDQNQLAAASNNPDRDQVGTYVEFAVYVLPAALSDTGRISWRDPKYSAWWEESRKRYDPIDGVAPIAPSYADFTSDGGKACFQVYEYGGLQASYTKRVAVPFGDTSASWYESIPKTRAAIRPRTLVYDAAAVPPTWTLQASQTPIINDVLQASTININTDVTVNLPGGGTTDVPAEVQTFERQCQGEYLVFPHYDDGDVLRHIRLVVDEYQYECDLAQRRVAISPQHEDFGHWGWTVHKFIYPDNEEFVYRQRFYDYQMPSLVSETASASWIGGDTVTNTYKTEIGYVGGFERRVGSALGDGSGESFTCAIHNWDPKTKRMVYTKEVYKDTYWYPVDGPRGNLEDWASPPDGEAAYCYRVMQADQYLYHYDGSGDALVPGSIDAGTTELWSDIPVQPSLAGLYNFGQYVGNPIIDPEFLLSEWLVGGGNDVTIFFYANDLYNAQAENLVAGLNEYDDLSAPTLQRVSMISSIGQLPGSFYTFMFTNAHLHVEWAAQDLGYEVGAFDNNDVLMQVVDRVSWTDYEISACCHTKYKTEAYDVNPALSDLITYSAQPHNVMPGFAWLPIWQKTNMLHYRDRWLVRSWFKHFPTHSGRTPDFTIAAFGFAPQPEPYIPPDETGPEWVIIGANFDIDAEVGFSGVTDVYPCAVIE